MITDEQYNLPDFSESYMNDFTARRITCELIGHDWFINKIEEDLTTLPNSPRERITERVCTRCGLFNTLKERLK